MEDLLKRNKPTSYCVGCGYLILDRFILRVFPDLDWHAECLKCAECHQHLDESCTCFIRDGKTFCKDHYSRFCTIKCAKCHTVLTRNMYVMRTRMNVYHSQCFRCESCNRQLLPGDEYVMRDSQLLCTDHQKHSNRLMGTSNKPHHKSLDTVDMSDDIESTSQFSPPWSSMQRRSERAARVRTVLSESQLRMLQTCYSANPRPDALMKEQLVEMTGLSPRVIRVWFQNKRCQDKKRCLMMRHTQKQLEGCLDISEESLLIACPESQDSDMFISPPWKLLTCFIEHKGADHQSYQQVLSLPKDDPCSAGREVVSISAQLPGTPNSLAASSTGMNE